MHDHLMWPCAIPGGSLVLAARHGTWSSTQNIEKIATAAAAAKGSINDENVRKGIVNIFLRAIYLKDNRFTLIPNGGDRPIEIDDVLLLSRGKFGSGRVFIYGCVRSATAS